MAVDLVALKRRATALDPRAIEDLNDCVHDIAPSAADGVRDRKIRSILFRLDEMLAAAKTTTALAKLAFVAIELCRSGTGFPSEYCHANKQVGLVRFCELRRNQQAELREMIFDLLPWSSTFSFSTVRDVAHPAIKDLGLSLYAFAQGLMSVVVDAGMSKAIRIEELAVAAINGRGTVDISLEEEGWDKIRRLVDVLRRRAPSGFQTVCVERVVKTCGDLLLEDFPSK